MFGDLELWTSAEVGKLSRVLSRRSTQLEQLLEALPVGIGVLERPGQLRYANRAFQAQHPEIAGLLLQVRVELDVVFKERRPQAPLCLAGGSHLGIYPHDDGTALVILLAETQCAPARSVPGNNRDFHLNAAEYVGAPVVVIDDSMQIAACNTAFAHTLGYEPAELAKINYRDLDGRSPIEAVTDGTRLRATLRHKSGSPIPVEIAIRIGATERGQVRIVTALPSSPLACPDNMAMATLERVSGQIAHRLNNLLTVVISYAELIQGDYATVESLGEELEKIHEAASTAARITRDLLTFSRGKPSAPAVIELDRAVAAMTSLLRNMADDVAVRILLHAPGVHVRLGAKDLEAILLNVVKNAKEAIIDCEGTVTIHTSRLEPDLAEDRTLLATMGLPVNGSYVRIQISDSGLGFPIEHQPHLFEPFFTTKAGATGMGLTLTYGMVRQAGGAITLERVVSGGTRVSIVLPQTITSDERD